MRHLLLFVALPLLAQYQSINLSGGTAGTATIPASAPFQNLAEERVEFRIHAASALGGAGSNQVIEFAVGSWWIRQDSATSFRVYDGRAGVTTFTDVDISANPDAACRYQRIVNQQIRLECWNAVTGVRFLNTGLATPTTAPSWNGSAILGQANVRAAIAFFRVFNTSLPANSPPPSSNDAAANAAILDWRFEGNLNASAGGVNWTRAGSTYISTPSVLPQAQITQTSAPTWVNGSGYGLGRVGQPVGLSGDTSTSDTTLTYSWAIVSAPQPTRLSAYTAATTALTPPVFGQYEIRLVIRDQNNQTSTASIKVGASVSDAAGALPNDIAPDLMPFLGRLTRSGTAPWTEYDRDEFYYAIQIQPQLAAAPWPFNTPGAGTISYTNGSATITGTGTSFLSTFACNNTDHIAIWYPRQSPRTGIGRRVINVVSCASNTQMTVGVAWVDSTGTTTGAQYSQVPGAVIGQWAGGSANWNYYDVVLAMYRAWARTGIEDIRTSARAFADQWMVWPLDQGYACDPSRFACSAIRLRALAGMMARAIDGRPEYWPMIYRLTDDQFSFFDGQLNNTRTDYDVREIGYQTWYYALHAKWDPDATRRADALNKARTWGDQWWIYKQANVVGTGRTVPDGSWPMTLDASQQYVGIGNLPWQEAFPTRALLALYDADPQTKWITAAYSNIDWQAQHSWCGGSLYSAYFTQAEGQPTGTCTISGLGAIRCTGAPTVCPSGQSGNRQLSAEYQSTFARRCALTGSTADCDRAIGYLGRTFGQLGGSGSDGAWSEYGVDLPVNGGAWDQLGKRFGFASGAGEAARAIGDVQAPYAAQSRTVTMSVAVPAGATATSVTITRPVGTSSTISCPATAGIATCSIPVDLAQGDVLCQVRHTVPGGERVSDVAPLRLQ